MSSFFVVTAPGLDPLAAQELRQLAEQLGKRVSLSVCDNGIAIDKTPRHRFQNDAFARAHPLKQPGAPASV